MQGLKLCVVTFLKIKLFKMSKTLKEVTDNLTDQGIMPVAIVSTTPWRTQRNYLDTPRSYEKNDKPSMTVPDQSLSIRELVYRYTHGLSLGGSRVPVYEDENEIQFPANWDKMDLSERHEFFTERAEELAETQERLKQEQNRITKEQREKEISEAVEAKLKAIRDSRKEVASEEPK